MLLWLMTATRRVVLGCVKGRLLGKTDIRCHASLKRACEGSEDGPEEFWGRGNGMSQMLDLNGFAEMGVEELRQSNEGLLPCL